MGDCLGVLVTIDSEQGVMIDCWLILDQSIVESVVGRPCWWIKIKGRSLFSAHLKTQYTLPFQERKG